MFKVHRVRGAAEKLQPHLDQRHDRCAQLSVCRGGWCHAVWTDDTPLPLNTRQRSSPLSLPRRRPLARGLRAGYIQWISA